MKGGAGLRRRCLRVTLATRSSPPAARSRVARAALARASSVMLNCSIFSPSSWVSRAVNRLDERGYIRRTALADDEVEATVVRRDRSTLVLPSNARGHLRVWWRAAHHGIGRGDDRLLRCLSGTFAVIQGVAQRQLQAAFGHGADAVSDSPGDRDPAGRPDRVVLPRRHQRK